MDSVKGSIIVFAKCPIAGSSKTRLTSLLGDEGAALLAKAMLSDILKSISEDVSCFLIPFSVSSFFKFVKCSFPASHYLSTALLVSHRNDCANATRSLFTLQEIETEN